MKKIIIIFFSIMLLIAIVVPAYLVFSISPVSKVSEGIILEVKDGDSAYSIGKRLKGMNAIKNARLFALISKQLKYDRKLQTGFYSINKNMSTLEIMKYLNDGKQVMSKFTIADGKNLYDIANILDSLELVSKADFIKAAHDTNILKKYNIPADSVEGYLYPSTYYIVKGNKAEKYITTMIDTLFKLYPREYLEKEAKKHSLTVHQLITMASIIQKEMGPLDEPKLISSVYYNRLNIKMRLQSCPTAIYAMVLDKGDAIAKPNLRKSDLVRDHKYNTYIYGGLPPGPISSVGAKAIEAAINPTTSDYLFFVADGNGANVFSKDYNTHLRYIDKYILKN